jgi:hypothetical protein
MLLISAPVSGIGLFLLSRATANSSYTGTLQPLFLVSAFGIGIPMVSLSIAAFAGIGDRDFGVASGLYNTSSQIGGAVGEAVLATVAYSHLRHGAAPGPYAFAVKLASVYTEGFATGIVVVAVALAAFSWRSARATSGYGPVPCPTARILHVTQIRPVAAANKTLA